MPAKTSPASSSRASSSTVEDYLERILELINTKGYARVVDIARSLSISQASVTNMVQRLDAEGLLKYEKYRGLVLTTAGETLARNITQRHQAFDRFPQAARAARRRDFPRCRGDGTPHQSPHPARHRKPDATAQQPSRRWSKRSGGKRPGADRMIRPTMDPKVLSVGDLAARRDALDRDGRRLVFTNGCFDMSARRPRALPASGPGAGRCAGGRCQRGRVGAGAQGTDPSDQHRRRPRREFSPRWRAWISSRSSPTRARPRLLARGAPARVRQGWRLHARNPQPRGVRAVLQDGRRTDRIRADGAGAFDDEHHRTVATGMNAPLVLGVLGSGKGSNYAAIAEAIDIGALNARVALVASDVSDAGILHLAERHGAPTFRIPPDRFKTKLEPTHEQALADRLRDAGVELVVLAGFMRLVKEPLITAFPDASSTFILRCCRGFRVWRPSSACRPSSPSCRRARAAAWRRARWRSAIRSVCPPAVRSIASRLSSTAPGSKPAGSDPRARRSAAAP